MGEDIKLRPFRSPYVVLRVAFEGVSVVLSAMLGGRSERCVALGEIKCAAVLFVVLGRRRWRYAVLSVLLCCAKLPSREVRAAAD